jgi:MoaA/NifB/PqqE/SkfB family radical SAM enzyme
MGDIDETEQIPLDEIKKILLSLKISGVREIDISGGEPFLRQDIHEIVSIAKDFEVKIHTNGSLITDELLLKLKEAGLKGFAVSLDSLDYDIQNKIRPMNNEMFAKIIDNIIKIKKHGFYIKINSVAFNSTIPSLKKLNDFCLRNKIDEHRICYFLPIGRGAELKDEIVDPVEWIEFARKNLKNKITKVGSLIAKKGTKNTDCMADEHIDILPNNKFYSCPLARYASRKSCFRTMKKLILGKIPKQCKFACPIRKFSAAEI